METRRRLQRLVCFVVATVVLGLVAGQAPEIPTITNAFVHKSTSPDDSLTLYSTTTVLAGLPVAVTIKLEWSVTPTTPTTLYYGVVVTGYPQTFYSGSFAPVVDGQLVTSATLPGIEAASSGPQYVSVYLSDTPLTATTLPAELSYPQIRIFAIPAGLSIFPIAMLLVVAIITRQILVSLFIGIWIGASFLQEYNGLAGFCRTLDTFWAEALGDPGHAKIILFGWFLAGMIGIISRGGGTFAMARFVSKFASTRVRGELATYMCAWMIFFDDYSNCMIVGNSMRPITDTLRISREKLAFISDCTAAPLASLIPMSAWIGYELSLIGEQLVNIGYDEDPFLVFLKTILSRYYVWYMIVMVPAFIIWKREFGPMLTAERRAFHENKVVGDDADMGQVQLDEMLAPVEGRPQRAINAILPIVLVIALVLLGLAISGRESAIDKGLSLTAETIFGNADSYNSLLWASVFVSFWAAFQMKVQGILSFGESIEAWSRGVKQLMDATLVLIMAWSIGSMVRRLQLDVWFSSSLSDSISKGGLPSVIFLISGIISFAMGSSWGTMAIVFPLAVPLAWAIAPGEAWYLYLTIGSILAGAVFGDHCSPISDTTVLSSMSAKCDISAHVVTQAPYALLSAMLSVALGYLPVGYSAYPDWAGVVTGCAAVIIVPFVIGVKVEETGPGRFDFLFGGIFRALKLDKIVYGIVGFVRNLQKKVFSHINVYAPHMEGATPRGPCYLEPPPKGTRPSLMSPRMSPTPSMMDKNFSSDFDTAPVASKPGGENGTMETTMSVAKDVEAPPLVDEARTVQDTVGTPTKIVTL